LKENNDLITQQNARLTEAHQEQNNLMAIVAHDLRSPLNNVKGLISLIHLSGPLNDEQLEMSEKTDQVISHGLELINDITNLSRFQNGVLANKENLSLNEYLTDLVVSHESYAQRKGISIILINENENIIVNTDKSFLTRILDKLISNAVKFSPHDSQIHVVSQVLSEKVYIKVKDQGPGMSEQDLKHAFQRFKKLSARPTGGENSSGLGLSIVKTLVEKLEGNITIESELGVGTQFILELPLIS
jgi:signal transduction histidine kinase